MTNKEILKIAMAQSAVDLCASASDFEKGFIRADVVSYDNLVSFGGYNQAKEAGKVRSEGKDYVVQDGDVMLFKFNV